MPVTARDRLETIVADYHHAHSEHRRAGVDGRVRRHLHTRLERLEAHFERLLEESVADEAAREAPVLDLEAGIVGQQRRGPAPLHGPVRVACGDVDPRDRIGGRGDLLRCGDRQLRQFLRMRRLGGKRVTQVGLVVHDIDVERNLLLVKGAVPGPKNAFVEVREHA